MSPLVAVILGLIQGVTEFFPISSSAHLILASHLFGWPDQGLAFDMAANSGSLLAVLVYFRREVAELVRAWLPATGVRGPGAGEQRRLGALILLATLPVAGIGFLGRDFIGVYARGPALIAATSIAFGALLGWADRRVSGRCGMADLGVRDALVIGLAQALALAPGTSRAGVTITAALFLGLSRLDAARFSFLLAIPVGLLVAARKAADLALDAPAAGEWTGLAIGFVVSGLSAYLAIHWLLGLVRRQSLMGFVAYRLILGLLVLGLV